MGERLFVGADWSAMESWLTAYHSGDATLLAELQAQLAGGPKVHARNAALIYGIDPAEAETHMVNLKGRMRPAYDGGKRLSHAWNYGMGERQGARTFWLAEKFMREAFAKLAAKYVDVVKYRRTLADRVFGEAVFRCPRCGFTAEDDGDCQDCGRAVGVPIPMRFGGYTKAPSRVQHTRFGRRRLYEGRRKNGANALASQNPQSCGASMWDITLARLHGWDPIEERPWPSPTGILRYDPKATWNALFTSASIFVATGTYDSFYLETPVEQMDEVGRWALWTMEQPWAALDGWRFPAEAFVGGNLGEFDAVGNVNGLRKVKGIRPLTLGPLATWR